MTTIGRIIKNGNGYELIELDLADVGKAVDDTVDLNLLIWHRCIIKAEKFCRELSDVRNAVDPLELAKTLFAASSIKLYTELEAKLVRRVHLAKNGQGSLDPVSVEKTPLDQSTGREKAVC